MADQAQFETYHLTLSGEDINFIQMSLQTRIEHIEQNVRTGYPQTKRNIIDRYKNLAAKISIQQKVQL